MKGVGIIFNPAIQWPDSARNIFNESYSCSLFVLEKEFFVCFESLMEHTSFVTCPRVLAIVKYVRAS